MPVKILVIDDDRDVLDMLMRVLSDAGHEVKVATDAKAGLGEIGDTKPDVLITDILMPEVDGIEVIKGLRRRYPDLWIVAISGGGSYMPANVSLKISEAFGADRTLYKPFLKADLLAAIKPS